jgi:hypothetical protein
LRRLQYECFRLPAELQRQVLASGAISLAAMPDWLAKS